MPRGSSSSIHQLLLQRVHIGGWEGSAVQHIKKLGEALGRYTGEEGSEKICDMARRTTSVICPPPAVRVRLVYMVDIPLDKQVLGVADSLSYLVCC